MKSELTIADFKISKIVPASVEVPNIDDLVANTDQMLKTYKEFPIVEDTYDNAKKARTQLTKTIDEIATVRKEAEKELLGNWPDVKAKMMSIEKAGKAAKELMTSQMRVIENERKEKRRVVVMNDVQAVANEQNIDWARIEFNERWLNVTYSRNDMLTEITNQITQLHKDDELKALQMNQIEITADELKIEPAPYLSMLGNRDLEDIKQQMRNDAEVQRARRQAKLDAAEREKQQAAHTAQQRLVNAKQVGNKLVDENGEIIPPASAPVYVAKRYVITATNQQEEDFINQLLAVNNVPFEIENK